MSKCLVYLAGPIFGETYKDARFGWRQTFEAYMPFNINVLSPMRQEGHLAELSGELTEDNTYTNRPLGTAKGIVQKDLLDIRRSDIVVANLLDAKRISIGTVAEIAMAYQMGKTIVLAMEPIGNPHDHPFVTELASIWVGSLEEAIEVTKGLLSEGV